MYWHILTECFMLSIFRLQRDVGMNNQLHMLVEIDEMKNFSLEQYWFQKRVMLASLYLKPSSAQI